MLQRLLSWSQIPSSTTSSPADTSSTISSHDREPVHLPDEIILEILSYFPEGEDSQPTLWACSLLSRQWHNLAISKLYAKPHLHGWNYDPFVRTICPSKNAHIRKSDLSGLVRTLDMSKLAYQGSKSITARLIGRTKVSLEVFMAPQANWGVNCLAALRHCNSLQTLDLSLLSEALGYRELSHTMEGMANLKTLRFPRSAPKRDYNLYTKSRMQWPPKLEDMTLAGDLSDFYYNDAVPMDQSMSNLPPNLTHLTIQHTRLATAWLVNILERLGVRLNFLRLNYIRFSDRSLPFPDGNLAILRTCPNLRTLQIDKNDCTLDLIYGIEGVEPDPVTKSHPLRHLYIANETSPCILEPEDYVDLSDIVDAMLDYGALPNLRKVTLECMFKMPDSWTEEQLELHRLLKQKAEEAGENPSSSGIRFAVLQAGR